LSPPVKRPAFQRCRRNIVGRVAVLVVALVFAQVSAAAMLRGHPKQEFDAPAAGSYTLPNIQRAPEGKVLDIDGRSDGLNRYTTGQITLLSFMYTYCVDPIGCPLAYQTLISLRARLLAQPNLARHVRFVSLSFDPVNDTPEAMKTYGGKLTDAKSDLRWHFLTTRSVDELKPIIDDFGQDVSIQLDRSGRPTRLFNHMLKVFLLDAKGWVREIYSSDFLLPDVIFNDIQTLILEQQRGR
jgi:protein SCO1/2